jgi:hypothetical protein
MPSGASGGPGGGWRGGWQGVWQGVWQSAAGVKQRRYCRRRQRSQSSIRATRSRTVHRSGASLSVPERTVDGIEDPVQVR